jgi:hypothetical protein
VPISLPIIENLVHPNVGRLSRSAVVGNPFSGPFISLVPPQPPPFGTGAFATYGVVLRTHTVPPQWGRDVSFPVEFRPPLGKMCCNYTDLSSVGVILQREFWTYDNQWYVFVESLPALFTLYLGPGVAVDLFWLHT